MSRLEWDRLSVYPYDSCNIQELLCKIYNELRRLMNEGKVFDPDEWNAKFDAIESLVNSLNTEFKKEVKEIKALIEVIQKKQIDIDFFGADPTGQKDSYSAIQEAIDFCNKHGIGELYIPAGKYKITDSLVTEELRLVGLSKPVIPNPIGFNYAFPRTGTGQYNPSPENRQFWLDKCRGSIIESKINKPIFADGLKAENIGIFGDYYAGLQDGISQKYGGPAQQIILDGVSIVCCGGNGVSAPYGLISSKIRNCYISQNGGFGIYIDRNVGPARPDTGLPYTGETNNLNIEHCVLNRNTKECIYANLSGRVFNIQYNEMEHVAYQSDMNVVPPDHFNLKYACVLNMDGQGGYGTGNVIFHSNYSESSQGLLWVGAKGGKPDSIGNNITVTNNLWSPYRQDIPSSGITLGGHLFNVTIWDNKLLSSRPVWAVDNIQGIVCNSPLLNYDPNNTNASFLSSLGTGVMNKFISNGYSPLGDHPELSLVSVEPLNNGANTRLIFEDNQITDKNFGIHIEDDSVHNIVIGNAMITNNSAKLGYVLNVSTANNLIDVSKPYEYVSSLVSGRTKVWVRFYEVGGLYLRNSDLDLFKCVPDSTGGITCIKKSR